MLEILSAGEKAEIHKTGRRILEEIGVRVRNRTVYDLLLDAGAVPDKNDPARLFIPGEMVDKYMSLCPTTFTIRNRKNEESHVLVNSGTLFYTANATQYLRGRGRKVVPLGAKEFTDFIRVADQLENVDGIVGTNLEDYPPHCRDFVFFRIAAQYSFKHLRPCIYTPAGAEAILEMADVINAGKSLRENMFFTLGYSVVSPLTWTETALELFYKTRGFGIPLMINSEPMAGGTSPVTLAGSLALADAEIISGIVVNQVLEP